MIGVMPANFTFPKGVDLWKPLMAGMNPQQAANRWPFTCKLLGRLKPGVTTAQAEAELNTIIGRVAQQHPETESPAIGWCSPPWPITCLAMRNWGCGPSLRPPGYCCSSLRRTSLTSCLPALLRGQRTCVRAALGRTADDLLSLLKREAWCWLFAAGPRACCSRIG